MNMYGNTQPFYSLIFMDCNMPIMDGFEASEEIRKLDFIDQDRLGIVALTANTNDSYKIRGEECGMNDFLTKPVSAATIQDTLTRYKIIN